jgi:hypothetical protein
VEFSSGGRAAIQESKEQAIYCLDQVIDADVVPIQSCHTRSYLATAKSKRRIPTQDPILLFHYFAFLLPDGKLSLRVLMDMQEQDQNQLNLELTDDVAEGHYCNLAMIAHSNAEFVLDFIRMMPGLPKARVKSRIVMTPEHAVRFVAALQENIARYEGAFGPIKNTPDGGHPNIPFNFGGTVGQA